MAKRKYDAWLRIKEWLCTQALEITHILALFTPACTPQPILVVVFRCVTLRISPNKLHTLVHTVNTLVHTVNTLVHTVNTIVHNVNTLVHTVNTVVHTVNSLVHTAPAEPYHHVRREKVKELVFSDLRLCTLGLKSLLVAVHKQRGHHSLPTNKTEETHLCRQRRQRDHPSPQTKKTNRGHPSLSTKIQRGHLSLSAKKTNKQDTYFCQQRRQTNRTPISVNKEDNQQDTYLCQ